MKKLLSFTLFAFTAFAFNVQANEALNLSTQNTSYYISTHLDGNAINYKDFQTKITRLIVTEKDEENLRIYKLHRFISGETALIHSPQPDQMQFVAYGELHTCKRSIDKKTFTCEIEHEWKNSTWVFTLVDQNTALQLKRNAKDKLKSTKIKVSGSPY